MSKILELREKRAKAWEAAKAFLDAKRTQEGFVSAEDAATYDKMEADVVNLGKEIERLERQAAIDAELAKATSTPITNQANNTNSKIFYTCHIASIYSTIPTYNRFFIQYSRHQCPMITILR